MAIGVRPRVANSHHPFVPEKTPVNLAALLAKRDAEPVRVALIGAGKFGTMILAQLRLMRGVRLAVLADLDVERARAAAASCGWAAEQFALAADLGSANDTIRSGKTVLVDSGTLAAQCEVDIVIEATGHEEAGARHAFAAIDAGHHVIMVTVEADVVVGPYLHELARRRGVIYSMAYGDQPAIICELVDWARTCGFPVVAAGRGHKWLPHFSESTPDTVWGNYGLTPEQATRGGLNPKMFNSFLDGSKPSIECTAVANATGLTVPSNGLLYPPASVEDIPFVTRPIAEGGVLERKGMVEVVSSLEADGRTIPYDIRMGVWVTVEGETEYIRNCFEEYNAHTDPSGRYFTLYKRWHLIGLEVGMSVASVALRREATGVAQCWNADVVATAKRDLKPGDVLDGEGGYTVWGKLLPAETSMRIGGLPLGLAHDVKVVRPVAKGASLSWNDVAMDATTRAYALRRELEGLFATPEMRAA